MPGGPHKERSVCVCGGGGRRGKRAFFNSLPIPPSLKKKILFSPGHLIIARPRSSGRPDRRLFTGNVWRFDALYNNNINNMFFIFVVTKLFWVAQQLWFFFPPWTPFGGLKKWFVLNRPPHRRVEGRGNYFSFSLTSTQTRRLYICIIYSAQDLFH